MREVCGMDVVNRRFSRDSILTTEERVVFDDIRPGLLGLRAAQRLALAAPPNGHYGSATAYKRKYVRNTAVGGVGYRRMLGRGMADDGY